MCLAQAVTVSHLSNCQSVGYLLKWAVARSTSPFNQSVSHWLQLSVSQCRFSWFLSVSAQSLTLRGLRSVRPPGSVARQRVWNFRDFKLAPVDVRVFSCRMHNHLLARCCRSTVRCDTAHLGAGRIGSKEGHQFSRGS
jgi:hypothetical protein